MYSYLKSEIHSIPIPMAKNGKQQKVIYFKNQQNNQLVREGGKFGCDYLYYLDDPDRCHAKYTLFKDDEDDIIGLNRLSEKVDKIPILLKQKIKILRQFRRQKKQKIAKNKKSSDVKQTINE